MLNYKSEINPRGLEIKSTSINAYLLEGENYSIALEIPSAKEINELKEGYQVKLSMLSVAAKDPLDLQNRFNEHLQRMLEKRKRFEKFPTYFVHLANLSKMASKHENAVKFYERAKNLSDAPVLNHYLSNAYIQAKNLEAASKILSECDLDKDIHANLRIAYLSVLTEDFVTAERHVAKSLEIDGSDGNARMFYGTLCLKNFQFEKAIRNFKIAYAEKPKSSPLLVNMAIAYWNLGHKENALDNLRRAVFINPLNQNAISFYADAAHLQKLDENAIPVLKKYLEYEQTSEQIWEKLARAYYCTSKKSSKQRIYLDLTLNALKHQESIKSDAAVWNNMGAVAFESGEIDRALRYYGYSIKKADQEQENEVLLPVYNLAALYISTKKYREAYTLIKTVVGSKRVSNDRYKLYEKIKLQFVVTLDALKKTKEAFEAIKHFIDDGIDDLNVYLEMLTRIFYYITVIEYDQAALEKYTPILINFLNNNNNKTIDLKLRTRAINNLAFSLIDQRETVKAEKYLNLLSNDFHKDPYSTATLGMAKLMKGSIEDGIALYREAISLVNDEHTRSFFRQRMYFELGKAHDRLGERVKAQKYLRKAVEENGFPYVDKQIKRKLNELGSS